MKVCEHFEGRYENLVSRLILDCFPMVLILFELTGNDSFNSYVEDAGLLFVSVVSSKEYSADTVYLIFIGCAQKSKVASKV